MDIQTMFGQDKFSLQASINGYGRSMYFARFVTHDPLFRGGEDHVCESPLGDSCFVMNIHNPFMHCVTSQYVFKLRDVIMLMRAVTIVAAEQQHRPPHRYHVAPL